MDFFHATFGPALADASSGLSPWHVVASSCALAAAGYLTWHYATFGFGGRLPVYPVVGILPTLIREKERVWDVFAEALEESPNMCFRTASPALQHKTFVTANPVHIEHILKSNFPNYPKGTAMLKATREIFGDGIFAVNGEDWKQQRKMASYEFSTNSLRSLMLVTMRDEIQQRLLPTLDTAVKSGNPVDMQDVLLRFTFDSICRIGFGVDTATLKPDFPDVPFATCIDRAMIWATRRGSMPAFVWRLMKHMQWGSEKGYASDMAVVDKFVRDVIAKRKRELASNANTATETGTPDSDSEPTLKHSDLLSRMMAWGAKEIGEDPDKTDNYLRDACISFLIAGRDTTAVSMSWFFWQLTQHPDVEERIVKELDAILARRTGESHPDSDGLFTFDELKQMTYLHAALNESMRLSATVPMDTKVCLQDDTLPDGTFIPKGWAVFYCIYGLGRMTRVWGPDALEFRPERWITAEGELRVESPFKFAVFNAGPRLCLGRDMAYLQMKSVASSVLRRYRLHLVPGQVVTYVPSITLLMKNGLQMTLSKRD